MTDPAAIEALARRIAEEAHAGQVDKAGEPYIGHVSRVAARLNDPLDRAVAYLHDVLEDCPDWTPGRLSARGAGLTFMAGSWNHIVGDVERLTLRMRETRAAYYERIKTSPRAVRVKLADIADNSDPERIAALDDATRTRLEEKYRKARLALGEPATVEP